MRGILGLPTLRPWSRRSEYQQLPLQEGTGGDGSAGALSPMFVDPVAANGDGHEKKVEAVTSSRRRGCSAWLWRWCIPRVPLRIFLPSMVIALLLLGFLYHPEPPTEEEIHKQEEDAFRKTQEPIPSEFFWKVFPLLHGYYHGVYSLVPWSQWVPEEAQWAQLKATPYTEAQYELDPLTGVSAPAHSNAPPKDGEALDLDPLPYEPYPDYASPEYTAQHHPVQQCFLDAEDTIAPPAPYVYPGVPQNTPMPFFGSYQELGLRHDVCFERFGRFGPYGYGYAADEGGLGIGLRSEQVGAAQVWAGQPRINWTAIDWGAAQRRCRQKNAGRFAAADDGETTTTTDVQKKLPRTAFLFRTWTGFEYTAQELLTLRSTISELALRSGGEYDVFLLLHVRNNSIPIWASEDVARQVVRENVPEEFWGITVLWSVQQMRMYYPGPFEHNFDNPAGSDIHEVYRGNHFPLQWFAAQHPEYEYVWNWEMDMRYSGHHYEFHDRVGAWARRQPRRGLWERNSRVWVPAHHGNWANFTRQVDEETRGARDDGQKPVWGPVDFPTKAGLLSPPTGLAPPTASPLDDDFAWGVGEEADLITFNPIFDPGRTNWIFRDDITGYDRAHPIPPRRCAIVTVARLSRRLLAVMHNETFRHKHSAFPEMWPPTAALHHGLKAVYIPHPVYFDRKWPLEFLDRTFNHPATDQESVFGWGEHNFLGSSFYYNSQFAGALWRRWLGERDEKIGGHAYEVANSGRMCLRPTLHHPVKLENYPE